MTSNKIDDTLIEKYIHSFLGYGNVNGDYWFIGKEEGGDLSLAQNLKRIHHWHERGEKEFEDLYDYHISINVLDWFDEKPKLQPTWNKLIRILLSVLGEKTDTDNVKQYQSKHLARVDSNTCLPELLPLPARSTSHWGYSAVSNLPYLNSRNVYREEIGNLRAINLRNKIDNIKPKMVVFYSVESWYVEKWRIISRSVFEENEGVFFASNSNTVFGIVTHPTTVGITNQYFHNAGKLFRNLFSN